MADDKKKDEKVTGNNKPETVVPEVPKPDYYMSGEYRGTNNQFSKGANYTLEVKTSTEGITVKDLKSEHHVIYADMKALTTDWMHVTQLLNYLP